MSPTPDRAVFGAFDGDKLVGTAGLQRESHRKLSHKALMWGVYVAPTYRKRGVGRGLIEAALRHAAGMPALRQVRLGVNATNVPAIELYRALGFEPYGVEKDFLMVDGVLHDEILMARLIANT